MLVLFYFPAQPMRTLHSKQQVYVLLKRNKVCLLLVARCTIKPVLNGHPWGMAN